MTDEERTNIFMMKHKKRIKNIEIAKALNRTPGLISSFFNGRTAMSKQKQEELVKFVENYPEYAIFKVQVNNSK
ncbi:hypothetical protein [Sporolactobacillus laevolacticus]|uniref:hypothetical protein n=1 Tax=Sporolactobacillus laevolacticus TaxID=33018 RepID=UPI0025B3A002|nr:hypothetical protein [Sporolactobacillus laevolacticus]MDN3956205.1 hypothetical protein [Sporolactobacillus laevolacticus]